MNLFGFFSISLLFLAYSTASKNGKDIESRMELLENMLSSQIQSQIDLQKELTKAKQELSSIQMTTNVTYAFSVRLHEDTETNDNPVIFGNVDLNIGDGYDEFVGGFTAPVSGVYLLTVYAMTASISGGPIFIKRNSDILCTARITAGNSGSDDLGLDTGTCTAITELTPEDTVRVTGSDGDPTTIAADYSGFAGHLLQSYA